MRKGPWWLALLVASACDCGEPNGGGAGGSAPDPAADEAPAAGDARTAILRDVDRRVLSEALREAASSSQLPTRRLATLGLARLHDPGAIPLLTRALADPDPEVRRNASLGLGAFEAEAPEGTAEALLGALAAERATENRAALLFDLGRVAGDESLPAFREALAGNEPEVRAAACTGLGSFGLRSRAVEPALLRRIAARMVDDTDPAVRMACSYALTRLPPPVASPPDSVAIVEDLARVSADDDAEVRAMAVRALGRYPEPPLDLLVSRTADRDWRVAVQAFRSLATGAARSPAAYARALRARLDQSLAAGLTGPELHVLLSGLESAGPLGEGSAVHGVATEAFDRIARLDGEATRDRGLAHCAAAVLVDRGRRWPTRSSQCGLGKVSEEEQRVAMAGVLGSLDGALAERAALVERIYGEGDARARQAALGAAPSLDPVGAAPIVLRGLASEDAGVITAALDAAVALAPRWRAPPAEASVLSIRPAGEPLPSPAAASQGPTDPQVRRALGAAWDHLSATDEVEGLQSWAKAVAALEGRSFVDRLGSLALHAAPPVRAAARDALRALGAEVPEGAVREVENPIAPSELIESSQAIAALLRTDRGEIEIELAADAAPTTVARFRSLAEAGYFDGLTFHRVVSAFVIQGGDPRGDGYGGPGWTQRCEDNRLPYRRGTVGMALAGRDTGGSQLFIAHGAQPHLEGRYTAFGRVVRGLDALDAIQRGDRILGVEITR